ncbi:hypothetical protein EII34_13340 [Arachnia propionica]|uniref:Uncharacterized protein n=1 Tax=Arachnia propionica TaxID=1750 RepID=A0A3P1T299_9ACTN|nr:hypothetical protein [Arachnia propionica]RRD03571.1 hypothetical protein EII34_13340 [Arachnia propionica]
MSQLYLVEVVPATSQPTLATVADVDHRVTDAGAQVVEVQVSDAGGHIMALIEADGADVVVDALDGLEAQAVSVPSSREGTGGSGNAA